MNACYVADNTLGPGETKITYLCVCVCVYIYIYIHIYVYKLHIYVTADGDCSYEIKRRLLLGRKVMTNLDSIFKSRDITLPTKVCLVKAMVFPVVMYGVRVGL